MSEAGKEKAIEPVAPSLWRGVVALAFPFRARSDYARWAVARLEEGRDGRALRRLAGMEGEMNLFALNDELARVLAELGVGVLAGGELELARARGVLDDWESGRMRFEAVMKAMWDIGLESEVPEVQSLLDVTLAWSEFESVDVGIASREEVPDELRKRGRAMVAAHQALFGRLDG